MPTTRRTVIFSLMAIFLGITVPLLMIEIMLRYLPVTSSTGTMAVDDQNPVIRYTPSQPFTWSKGWRFAIVNTGRINNYGFVNDQDYTREDHTRPLVVIGDSYVEAFMVPYEQTIQGRLARLFEKNRKVYSIGISGAQLAQYLAFGQYARTEFQPGAMVFVIVGNDFDESLTKYKEEPGYYVFQDDGPAGHLKLVRKDYRPSLAKRLLRCSALVRYLWGTVGVGGISSLITRRSEHERQYVGNTSAHASEERIADSQRVVDQFFHELPQRTGLDKSRVLFVVDAMRPEIYSESDLQRAKASYVHLMRQYFLEAAVRNGYEVIDMEPRFMARYRRDGARFEFAIDGHWNGLGHQEAAEAIAFSSMLRALDAQ